MHVIRLRRPWQRSHDGGSSWDRVDIPDAAAADTETGDVPAVLYRRSFNLPTGLTPASRVFLRIEGWEGKLESVMINDTRVDITEANIDADVTDRLESHNQIVVCIGGRAGKHARLSGEVSLAIEDGDDGK